MGCKVAINEILIAMRNENKNNIFFYERHDEFANKQKTCASWNVFAARILLCDSILEQPRSAASKSIRTSHEKWKENFHRSKSWIKFSVFVASPTSDFFLSLSLRSNIVRTRIETSEDNAFIHFILDTDRHRNVRLLFLFVSHKLPSNWNTFLARFSLVLFVPWIRLLFLIRFSSLPFICTVDRVYNSLVIETFASKEQGQIDWRVSSPSSVDKHHTLDSRLVQQWTRTRARVQFNCPKRIDWLRRETKFSGK